MALPRRNGTPARPWALSLARFNLDGLGVQVVDQTFVTPLTVDVANIRVGFKADAQVGVGAVQLESRRGTITASAWVTDRVAEGVVFANFHFNQPNNANELTQSTPLDPVAKIPEYKMAACRIESKA